MTKLERLIISAINNKDDVLASDTCTCIYCAKTFPKEKIIKFVEEEIGEPTALCPSCKHPTLIPSNVTTTSEKELRELKIRPPFDLKQPYYFFQLGINNVVSKTLNKISGDIYPDVPGKRNVALSKSQALRFCYFLTKTINNRAFYLIGNMFYSGYLGVVDYTLALKYYLLASKYGYTKASINAGDIYYEGLLGKPNYTKAYTEYSRAYLLNKNDTPNGIAKCQLARFYFEGKHVKKDLNAASVILFDTMFNEREKYREKNRSPVLGLSSFYLAELFAASKHSLPDPYLTYKLYLDALNLLKDEPEYSFRFSKLLEKAEIKISEYHDQFYVDTFAFNEFTTFESLQRFIHFMECDVGLTAVDYNKFSNTVYLTVVLDDAPISIPECGFVGPVHSLIIGIENSSGFNLNGDFTKAEDIRIDLNGGAQDASSMEIYSERDDKTIGSIMIPHGFTGAFIAKITQIDNKGNYDDIYHTKFDGFVSNPDDLA